MIRYCWILILFFLLVGEKAESQEHLIEKKNLQPDWEIYSSKGYHPFNDSKEPVTTIYFSLNANAYKGDYVVLKSADPFSVWLNGVLLFDTLKELKLSIDSLQEYYQNSSLAFAIHQEEKIDFTTLRTAIYSKATAVTTSEKTPPLRKRTAFPDFMISAVLTLLIFLVIVIRLNPRLSSDYFSITKIFSIRDSEDDPFYYRLTSTNILFYLFASMTMAVYLLIISQFIEFEIGLSLLRTDGYASLLLTWLKVSLVILILLFGKMVVIYSISTLFGIRDMAGFHFFNFIRLLLVIVGLLTLVLTFYNILHGQSKVFYSFLLTTLSWVLGGWVILLFLKLTNRVAYSVFHLFSYICATEIIPFLLIIKVLNE